MAEFENEIINKSLYECPNIFEWMPDLSEFKNLCRLHQSQKTCPFAQRLKNNTLPKNTYKKAQDSISDEHLKKCWEALGHRRKGKTTRKMAE